MTLFPHCLEVCAPFKSLNRETPYFGFIYFLNGGNLCCLYYPHHNRAQPTQNRNLALVYVTKVSKSILFPFRTDILSSPAVILGIFIVATMGLRHSASNISRINHRSGCTLFSSAPFTY